MIFILTNIQCDLSAVEICPQSGLWWFVGKSFLALLSFLGHHYWMQAYGKTQYTDKNTAAFWLEA